MDKAEKCISCGKGLKVYLRAVLQHLTVQIVKK